MTSSLSVNGNRLWQSLMDLAESGATPKAVSYTHLDVYKRQAWPR